MTKQRLSKDYCGPEISLGPGAVTWTLTVSRLPGFYKEIWSLLQGQTPDIVNLAVYNWHTFLNLFLRYRSIGLLLFEGAKSIDLKLYSWDVDSNV